VNVLGSVALGDTHQEVRISGTTDFADPGVAPIRQQGGLLALPTNIGTYSRDQFSVVPEIGHQRGRQVTDHVRVFAGYTLLYWSNVVGQATKSTSASTRRNCRPRPDRVRWSARRGRPSLSTTLISGRKGSTSAWSFAGNFGAARTNSSSGHSNAASADPLDSQPEIGPKHGLDLLFSVASLQQPEIVRQVCDSGSAAERSLVEVRHKIGLVREGAVQQVGQIPAREQEFADRGQIGHGHVPEHHPVTFAPLVATMFAGSFVICTKPDLATSRTRNVPGPDVREL